MISPNEREEQFMLCLLTVIFSLGLCNETVQMTEDRADDRRQALGTETCTGTQER